MQLEKKEFTEKEMFVVICQATYFTYLNYLFLYFNHLGLFQGFNHCLGPLEGYL